METDGQYKSLYRTGAAESFGTIGTRPNLFWPIFESFLALFSWFFTNENENQRKVLKESVRPNQILIASAAPLEDIARRDSWNNHLVKCQHQSSISSLLWAGPEQMSSFYGLNKCVQYASLIEIPAAVVQISIDRLQPLLKTSSNDMASLCKLTEPERNGLAHLVSPNFK